MKKIWIIFISAFLLVGCGNKDLNLDTIQKRIKESNLYEELKVLSDEELKNLYSIESTLAEKIVFAESTDPNKVDTYIIVKIKDDKIKDQIATRFEALELQCEMYNQANALKVKNRLETTYNGYNIYIISDNNEEVLKLIKE